MHGHDAWLSRSAARRLSRQASVAGARPVFGFALAWVPNHWSRSSNEPRCARFVLSGRRPRLAREDIMPRGFKSKKATAARRQEEHRGGRSGDLPQPRISRNSFRNLRGRGARRNFIEICGLRRKLRSCNSTASMGEEVSAASAPHACVRVSPRSSWHASCGHIHPHSYFCPTVTLVPPPAGVEG